MDEQNQLVGVQSIYSATANGLDGAFPILMHVEVVPYGVLGFSTKGQVASEPDSETAFVDPAGLHFIEYGPSGAGGAAGVIYRWLGIASHSAFPDPVRSAITAELLAKYHAYGAQGEKKCIHVVGPDLGSKPYTRDEAVAELAQVYHNVFVEFGKAGLKRLRLLPVSGGIFSGPFSKQMHEITAEAVEAGFQQLSIEQQQNIVQSDVEMCIFEADSAAKFEKAFLERSSCGAPSNL